MALANTPQWGSIERWSPTLFLVGGSLLSCHAAVAGIHAFTNLTMSPDVFGPTGHLIALLGLLGLFPTLADRRPLVARVVGAVTAVAIGSWAVMAITRVLVIMGVVPSLSDVLPGAFVMAVFASTILTYFLFSIAILRVDEGSRAVGLLVSVPGALLLVAMGVSAIVGMTASGGFIIAGGTAVSLVALGYTLRMRGRTTEHALPAADVTAG
jgi:hypothetical protein